MRKSFRNKEVWLLPYWPETREETDCDVALAETECSQSPYPFMLRLGQLLGHREKVAHPGPGAASSHSWAHVWYLSKNPSITFPFPPS